MLSELHPLLLLPPPPPLPNHPSSSTASKGSHHCPLHARDFSDCLAHHIPWPPHCFSKHSVLEAIAMEALRSGRRQKRCASGPCPAIATLAPEQQQQRRRRQRGEGTFEMDPSPPQSIRRRGRGQLGIDSSDSDAGGSGSPAREAAGPMEMAVRANASSRAGRSCDEGSSDFYFSVEEGAKSVSNIPGASAALERCPSPPRITDEQRYGQFEVQFSDFDTSGSGFRTHEAKSPTEMAGSRNAAPSARRICDEGSISFHFSIEESCQEGAKRTVLNIREGSAALERCCMMQIPAFKVLSVRTNPWDMLGEDLILKIFSLLDAHSLARCGAVSKGCQLSACDDNLWTTQCNNLWEGRAHLPCLALQVGLSKMKAYSISVKDSKRTRITINDLCDHAWEFRFKSTSPEYWLNLDPSWHGEPPMMRYFHFDGSQTAGPDDAVWGGHECRYYIVDIVMSTGDHCRFVRINHWPLMRVSRTEDWGWELQNGIYIYNSIPDSWKPGGTGPMRAE